MHIAVLMGGWSAERPVSLQSGNGCADALESLGHRVTRIDMQPDVAARLAEAKPDLEALTVLPPFGGHPFGALLGLGSGSAPGRDRGFVWALDAHGELRGDARQVDLAPLYGLLSESIEQLNIEGAAVMKPAAASSRV